MDSNLRLGMDPLYTAPFDHQIAFTKRWCWGVSAIGAYVCYASLGVASLSVTYGLAGFLLMVLPVPLAQYFTKSYVTRIHRVYRRDEPQTLENMTRDETLAVERVSLSGRKTYTTLVKLQDIRLVNKRRGWVNWEVRDSQGVGTGMYVSDNIGGLRMDRIWGIIEHNSGIDNGRYFDHENVSDKVALEPPQKSD